MSVKIYIPKSYISILKTIAQLLPDLPHTPFSDRPLKYFLSAAGHRVCHAHQDFTVLGHAQGVSVLTGELSAGHLNQAGRNYMIWHLKPSPRFSGGSCTMATAGLAAHGFHHAS